MSFGESLRTLAMQSAFGGARVLVNQRTKTPCSKTEQRSSAGYLGGVLLSVRWRNEPSIGPFVCMARVVPALVRPLTLTSYFASTWAWLCNERFVMSRVHSMNLSVVMSRVNVKAFKGKGVPSFCARPFLSRRNTCNLPCSILEI